MPRNYNLRWSDNSKTVSCLFWTGKVVVHFGKTDGYMDPQFAEQAVAVALRAIFGRWTALRLVIEHQCGGAPYEANQLLDTTIAMATSPSKRHETDEYVELFYSTFDRFNTDIEDGSPEEVAALILSIRDAAAIGNMEPAEKAAEKAGMSSNAFKASVEGQPDIDEDNSDHCPERNIEYEPPRTRSMAAVDEDGFTQVPPRRERR